MNKTTLRIGLKASVIALALAALPLNANAAGLGKITVLSVLGQPLRAEVDISANQDEMPSLSARIAPSEAFRQAGIEYSNVLFNVRVSVDKRADGRPYLILRSDQAINEPFLDLLLEMNWASGRLLREYTFLLDPPESLLLSQQKPAAQAAPVSAPIAAPAPQARREAPAVAPVEPKSAETVPATKKPGEEMKVARGADGVQRIVKAVPQEAPAEAGAGASHLVKRGDTLSKIANETKPEGVNLDQMLVALFRSNKGAFDGGNINRLKAGKILAIPDHDSVVAIDAKEAKEVIVAQSADFAAYRKKLAAATISGASLPVKEEAPKQAVSGKIGPKVQDKAPAPAPGSDKLEVSKSATSKDSAGKSAAARTAAIEEDLIAREKALKEANTRITELDKNLSDMKKLLELKSQSVADSQKQAQTAKPTPTPTPAPVTAPAAPPAPIVVPALPAPEVKKQETQAAPTPVVAEQPAEKPVETGTPAKASDASAAEKSGQAKPAEVDAKKSADAKPVARKVAPPPPPPPPETSFIDDNPELLFGGGGIVALLLGYLGFAKWRKKRQETQEDTTGPISQSEPSINSVFGSTGGQIVDTGSAAISSLDTDFSVAGVGGTDTNEGVDPIAEADVYMAYGRNAQAEEILLDALKTDPTRHAIHVKLLEIYAARKSLKQFESIATDLRDQTGGRGDEWEQAAQLGLQIDPDNSLYSEKSAVAATTAAAAEPAEYNPAATMVMSPQDLGKITEEFRGQAADERLQATIMEPASTLVPEAPVEDVPESLDFELDLDSGSTTAEGDLMDLGAAPSGSAGTDTEELDIDFDLGGNEPPATRAAATPAAATPAAATAASLAQTDDNIIDFEMPVPAAKGAAVDESLTLKMPESADGTDAGLNFDLGMRGNEIMPAAPPVLSTGGVDLSSISLELDDNVKVAPQLALESEATPEPALVIPPLTAAAAALSTPPATPTTAAAPSSAASQEVDTKLELASAYEEMGDKDGARELLQEVLNEGTEAQKTVARSKLELLA